MPNEFHFKLANEKLQKYYLQCRAMHIMAAILLILYALPYALSIQENWMMLLGILLPSIAILAIALFKKSLIVDVHNNRILRILEAGFLFMGAMHFLQLNSLLPALLYTLVAIIMLLLLWMESRIFNDQYIVFLPDTVEIEKAFITKKYTWPKLIKVTLKNDYITLHLKENTFEQVKILWPRNGIDTEMFLTFCNEKIGT